MKQIIYLFILGFIASLNLFSQNLVQPYYITPRTENQHIDLSESWQLNYTDDALEDITDLPANNWVIVKEPTSVQIAWYKAGKLPDPYAHLNAEDYVWMEEKAWYYKKEFEMPEIKSGDNIFLAFDGIDYYSRIWLNGNLLGTHNGMWGGPMIHANKYIKSGEKNEVVVEVKSGNYNQWDSFDWRNPGEIIKSRTFAGGGSHKPFFALGMWQGVRIEIVPKIHLERPCLVTKKIVDGQAQLHLAVELFVNKQSLQYELHPWHETQVSNFSDIKRAPDFDTISQELKLKIEFIENNTTSYSKTFDVLALKGRSWIEEDFVLENPKLWLPNGMGEPNLYKVKMSLNIGDKAIDRIDFNYGIRTIEQKRSDGPRTGDRWENWQFVINNKPIFIKGINWMPSGPLYDFTKEKYEWLISAAHKAGIQMIRIWGGGLIETDAFYDACNRYGIMVWQDFPKNNNVTPDWPQDIWEANVVQSIVRLRNQPSLAVWCGGNEFNPYAFENASTMNVLERSLADFDPTRLWLRTSPDHGSTHLYPDFDPTWYKKELNIVPYIAETGIHSIPEAVSLYEVVEENEFKNLGNMYNEGFKKNHPEFIYHFMEYSPGRVPRMLSRASHIDDMSNPTIEAMSEATQIGAGEFYQVMSEGIQSNYPITTGLMPWVFKRPWPTVAAIHLLDGFGQPSAPYYFLKRTYEPLHVALNPERLLWKSGEVFPVDIMVLNSNDNLSRTDDINTISVEILDHRFNRLYSKKESIKIKVAPSVTNIEFERFKVPKDYKNKYFFVVVSLLDDNQKEISRSVYWPRTISQMEEQEYYKNYISSAQPWPTLEDGPWLKPALGQTRTSLSAKVLSKIVTKGGYTELLLEIENKGKIPSFMTKIDVIGSKRLFVADDNFFWMQPGEKREIKMSIKWREGGSANNSRIFIDSWNAKSKELKF